MVRKYVVTGALTALLIWLELRRGRAAARTTEPKATLSTYVMKDGACYKVDFHDNGTSTSRPAAPEDCSDDWAREDGFIDPAPDPDLGFNRLVHLFDDL
jgi:hypothetical protein